MQHQFWVTKKSVSRKFGGKEDECVVASDAELDAKLELFRSISDSCVLLQRVIDVYQERLCYLAQEENALGRYLKDCGKNEKNTSAGQIMQTAGKALAYTGHQRLTIRPPLVRLHHEVETFRGRAVSDTRTTVLEMEKARTEYRAALSWMKSVSTQLDPDTGHGLERFRKAQSYVRSTKVRFDRLMLACLQKVDLLAAARCNMFSHVLVSYQSAISTFSTKVSDTLSSAASKLGNVKPYDFCVVSELATPQESKEDEDKDQKTFFNAEYTDVDPQSLHAQSENACGDLLGNFKSGSTTNLLEGDQDADILGQSNFAEPELDLNSLDSSFFLENRANPSANPQIDLSQNSSRKEHSPQMDLLGKFETPLLGKDSSKLESDKSQESDLLGEDFSTKPLEQMENLAPSAALFEMQWPATSDFLGGDFMPSRFIQDGLGMGWSELTPNKASVENKNPVGKEPVKKKTTDKPSSQMTWLSLFAELDPLANQDGSTTSDGGDRA